MSTLTLTISEQNTLFLRQGFQKKMQDLNFCCIEEMHFKYKGKDEWEVNIWEKICHKTVHVRKLFCCISVRKDWLQNKK